MKLTIVSILVGGALVGGALMYSGSSRTTTEAIPLQNVSTVDGKQIIAIGVKGGYSPRISTAKANIPTTLRMTTNATFDCSSGLTIPAMKYQKYLPPSGVTDIELPPQKTGTKLEGVCVMGMYNFEVSFD